MEDILSAVDEAAFALEGVTVDLAKVTVVVRGVEESHGFQAATGDVLGYGLRIGELVLESMMAGDCSMLYVSHIIQALLHYALAECSLHFCRNRQCDSLSFSFICDSE